MRRRADADNAFVDWFELEKKGQDLAERRIVDAPTAKSVSSELEKLPVAERSLLVRYAGSEAGQIMLQEPSLAEASKWLGEMNALSLYARQGLAWCKSYISILKSVVDQEPPDELALSESVTSAGICMAYHLRNGLQDLYSFREKFAQFCNAYCKMGLSERDPLGRQVRKKLQASTASSDQALLGLAKSFDDEAWLVAMELRNMIVHRSPSFPEPALVRNPLPSPGGQEEWLPVRVARLTQPATVMKASNDEGVIELSGVHVTEYVAVATMAFERMMVVMNGTLKVVESDQATRSSGA